RIATAKNLRKAAADEEENTPLHYVVLSVGRDMAAGAAAIDVALAAVDRLDEVYAIDVWAMKLQVFETASRKTPKDGAAGFSAAAMKMTQQAMADEHYEIAGGIVRLATAAARRTKDRDLIRQAAELASHATRIQKAFQATIAPALAKLKTSPDDPAANLITGRHYCLNRAAWQIGLKMLEKSDHEEIKAAAQFDLSQPTDHRKQVVVGDAWYEVAKSGKTLEGFHARAHYWYETALGELTGLAKLKVENRMKVTAEFAARAPKPAMLRVARDGTRIGSASGQLRAVLKTTVTVKFDANVMGHVAFSPDGRTLAVGYPRRVRLFDVEARKFGFQMEDTVGSTIHSIAFSPDGKTLLTGNSSGSFTVWNPRTGGEVVSGKAGSGRIRSLIFTPDGTRMVMSVDSYMFMVVDVSTWQPIEPVLQNREFGIGRLALSADGAVAMIAHTTNGWVSLVDVKTAKYMSYLKGHTAPVSGMAFSPDGKLLVTGSADHSVRLWNSKSGELVKVLDGHKAAVLDVAFAPDSQMLASVSADNTVKLWGSTGKMLLTLKGHASHKLGDLGSIVFSPDGRYLASCGNLTLKIWAVTGR
ncbi:MAG: WD40 repeat domain-containing protein, partial [Planctomycetes bacterium]|nr:WD40 repeat domain-containing protein [Planctomycetota bacterium]